MAISTAIMVSLHWIKSIFEIRPEIELHKRNLKELKLMSYAYIKLERKWVTNDLVSTRAN